MFCHQSDRSDRCNWIHRLVIGWHRFVASPRHATLRRRRAFNRRQFVFGIHDLTPPQTAPLPAAEHEIIPYLHSGEHVVASFSANLGPDLRFGKDLLVLTNRRVLLIRSGRPSEWPLEEIRDLETTHRNGLSSLQVIGPHGMYCELVFTGFRDEKAAEVEQLLIAFRRLRKPQDLVGLREPEPPVPEPVESVPVGAATSALRRLVVFARPQARAIALGMLLTLATTIVGLIPLYLTQPLTDEVLLPTRSAEQRPSGAATAWLAAMYVGGMAVAALISWGLSWGKGILLARASERISAHLRNHTYSHLQTLSVEFFGGKRTGDLMARISTDTDRICQFLSDNLVDFVTDLLLIAATAALLLYTDWKLAVASLAPFPLIAWLIVWSRARLSQGFLVSGRAWGYMTSVLADTIPGIRVVKAFAQEHREIERFAEANRRVVAANDRVNAVWTFFWPVVVLLNQLGWIVVWAFGAWRVSTGEITFGVLTLFLTNISLFYSRLESMSRIVNATQRAGASAQRIFEVLDRVPAVPEPARPVIPQRLRGEVEVRNIGFRYGNRQVIEGLSLRIAPGEMVGLVGQTGAGKSTLVNLICRFFDVNEGAILVDGTDIRAYPVSVYRQQIGIVLQDPFLFFGTIAENIAYGKPQATREEVIAAAKAARAHEFILRLPDGYDSLVGERGQSLSGGERQRISIARALLVDPRLLILDEATSAVDAETEREIQSALDRLVEGRTTIAIAHRLSTLRKANRIVVLDRGQIVEVGSHAELLAKDGAYARLHRAQSQAVENIGC